MHQLFRIGDGRAVRGLSLIHISEHLCLVDPYMIYEAKVLGATAVLLICALLPEETLKEYLETAHALGLSALVEAHDEAEVAHAMRAGDVYKRQERRQR